MEAFSYLLEIEKQMRVFCEKTAVNLQTIKFKTGNQGRQVIEAFIEGRVGHYLLCPKKITKREFVMIENSMDIEFPDKTKAIAEMELACDGKLVWVWKITWERNVQFPDW